MVFCNFVAGTVDGVDGDAENEVEKYLLVVLFFCSFFLEKKRTKKFKPDRIDLSLCGTFIQRSGARTVIYWKIVEVSLGP